MSERPFTPVIGTDSPPPKSKYVYFIQGEDGGPIKIGIATDPLVRLYNMQSGCPIRLVILGCIRGGQAVERRLHARFAGERLHFEWFSPSERLLAFIADALREAGVPPAEYEAEQGIYRPRTVLPFMRRSNG